jgi:hypothetical protein
MLASQEGVCFVKFLPSIFHSFLRIVCICLYSTKLLNVTVSLLVCAN